MLRGYRERTEDARTSPAKKQKQNVNPYSTDESQYFNEEEFKAIAEYSRRTGTCVNMCQGRKCIMSRCPYSHDQAYKKQPWFAGDYEWTEENTKYTMRLAWTNPYNTEESPTFSQEDFQKINDYVTASG